MEEHAVSMVAASLEAANLNPDDASTLNPSGKMQWVDVLADLDAAAEEMTLGDLLSGPQFDLQDAMSALEIGDPQMDTGMRVAADLGAVEMPLPAVPDVVEPPFFVALLDEIMCAEHGWYSGLTLTQTVYEIEWMQTALEVEHLPLRAALCATARAVSAARSIVLRGDIHEEEDFAGSVNGLKLHEGVSEQDLMALLNDAEEHCAAQLRTAKAAKAEAEGTAAGSAAGGANLTGANSSAASCAGASMDPASGEREDELQKAVDLAEAVLCRMRFRRGFCGALRETLHNPPPRTALAHGRHLAAVTWQPSPDSRHLTAVT